MMQQSLFTRASNYKPKLGDLLPHLNPIGGAIAKTLCAPCLCFIRAKNDAVNV